MTESHAPAPLPPRPRLVLNDRTTGIRVLTRIQRELQACRSFRFYVAFANQQGVVSLLQTLEELRIRGTRGRVLVSQYLNFTDPVALRTLLRLTNLEVRIATEGSVHAKGYYFHHDTLERYIIGSSNWTESALATNTELNLQVEAAAGSDLGREIDEEFDRQFDRATPLTAAFIETYERIYREQLRASSITQTESTNVADQKPHWTSPFAPNSMQVEALESLANLRLAGERKALIISATGTGKTFLSAFDVQRFDAKRMLFVVHRENIARAAMASFTKIFGPSRTCGLYTGNRRNSEAEFVFCTVQTMSRPEHLAHFAPDYFDYIIVDESHRAGAASYARFLNHFDPKFLLGMTATPERTDGSDIFQYFDHNIGYEIRLQRALEEEMLCPFHYFGVTDLTVNDEQVSDHTDFNRLAARQRVDQILDKARLYGCDDGVVRGLVFCSRVDEAHALSKEFTLRGYRSLALDGSASEDTREQSIRRLEAAQDAADKLDYIFTVDIFNEGVDIPQCNQIILLRPTQSAIVFVQQLGRGLRKVEGKDKYLTVIDFIGNYTNNFLIPIALFGDRSYDKDRIRRLMVAGNEGLPGTSTINFDRISRERIFASIDGARTMLLRDLRADFRSLRDRIGRIPMMRDFLEHDLRDPVAFSDYAKSFHEFSRALYPEEIPTLEPKSAKTLEVYSRDGLNGKSIEEPVLIRGLLEEPTASLEALNRQCAAITGVEPSSERWDAAIRCLNLRFLRESAAKTLVPIGEKLGVTLIERRGETVVRLGDLELMLGQTGFAPYLRDLANYALSRFIGEFDIRRHVGGFVRYRKYGRADVFRILGAPENPVAQNVGGYLLDPNDRAWCPIFVTYRKPEGMAATTQYEDAFLDRQSLQWFTKSRRTLTSPDVQFFQTASSTQRMPLFIKKSNDEGIDFYYMGDVRPDPATFSQQTMRDEDGGSVPVVRMTMHLDEPVHEALYDYIVS